MSLVITPDTLPRVRELASELSPDSFTERDLAVAHRVVTNMQSRATAAVLNLLHEHASDEEAFRDGITVAGEVVMEALTALTDDERDEVLSKFQFEGVSA